MSAAKQERIRSATGSIAEFGPAVAAFIIVILFPLIDLIGLTYGMGTVFFVARQCASRAGTAVNYSQALGAAVRQAREMTGSGIGKFAKLQPVGGYDDSGVDLYIYETNINTNEVHMCGPNELPPAPVDPSSNVYQLLAQVTFDIGPFMDLNSVPLFGNVPGLGKPARISYGATASVEHPQGIVIDDGYSANQGGPGIEKGDWMDLEPDVQAPRNLESFR